MFFYKFENLNGFIDTDFENKIINEAKYLENTYDSYLLKKDTLDNLIRNILDSSEVNLQADELNVFQQTMENVKETFEKADIILETLDSMKDFLSDALDIYQNTPSKKKEIKDLLNGYNLAYDELMLLISEFETDFSKITSTTADLFIISSKEKSNISSNSTNDLDDIEEKQTFNNVLPFETDRNSVLLISEKSKMVYLPYYYDDVYEIYNSNRKKYSSEDDVINRLYSIPLSRFKSLSFARFREAYKLIRTKEKGSLSQALDLALELMFKSNLHPAIIAACRNLEELDFYLDCLEGNNLKDFNAFEIRFEYAPTVKNSNDNFAFYA